MVAMVKLAMRAVQDLGWKLSQANETGGLVTFETGRMNWHSWSGVSGSINVEEIAPGKFRATGTGMQNVRGAQLVAPFGSADAQKKANQVIIRMKSLVLKAPLSTEPQRVQIMERVSKLRTHGYVEDAEELIYLLDGSVSSQSTFGNVFKETRVVVKVLGKEHSFASSYEMVRWTINELIPRIVLGEG
jgi:hypothetical protein